MSSESEFEQLHDRLVNLEMNIIDHLDRNARFARRQEKNLVGALHIDPKTIPREPSSDDVVESKKGEPTFRDLAEKLVKDSVIEMRDNIKNTFEIYQEKRYEAARLKTPFNNEEKMFELLSIYALNLIPLITSLSLVPEYKKIILKIIQDINQTISSIESEIRDEYIGRFDSQIKTIILKLFQLPSPNSVPIPLPFALPVPSDDKNQSRLYDLLRSGQPPLATLLAPSKTFLIQHKTFLEKLITLYEQVEERKAGGFKQLRSVKTRMRKSRKNNKSRKQKKYK
jgi:hypothetical protein